MRTALFESDWGPIALGLGVGCLMLVATLVALARPRGAWLRDRLDPYGRLDVRRRDCGDRRRGARLAA